MPIPDSSLLELARFAAGSVVAILLPGYTLLRLLRIASELPRPLLPHLIALGWSFNALLFLGAWATNIPLTLPLLASVYSILLLSLAFLQRGFRESHLKSLLVPHSFSATVGSIALFLGVFLLRLLPLKGQIVAPGIDAYHHTMIVDLISRARGIPVDYSPYAELGSFTYHFGTHANAAAVALISGLPPHRVVLYLGPFLLATVSVGVWTASRSLVRDSAGGATAGAVVGFLTVVPAWYINWSRLPQLAGLSLLTIIIACLFGLEVNAPAQHQRRRLLFLGVIIAGLFLTHYRVTIMLISGVLVWLLVSFLRYRTGWAVLSLSVRVALAFALASVLTASWIAHLLTNFQFDDATATIDATILPPPFYYSLDRIPFLLRFSTTSWVLALAFVGLLLGIRQRQPRVLFPLLWLTLLVVGSNPYALPFPGIGLVDFVTVATSAFVPAGLLIAFVVPLGLGRIARYIPRAQTGSIFRRLAISAAIFTVVTVGANQTWNLLQPASVYVSPDDMNAFRWIARELPRSSSFVTELRLSRIGLVEYVDGGAWITYFTGRSVLVPPLNYRIERYGPSVEADLKQLVTVMQSASSAEQLFAAARARGATHLYLGSASDRLKQLVRTTCPSSLRYENTTVMVVSLVQPCANA